MASNLIGAHTSIVGGPHMAVARAEAIGGTTMQIFTKSNRTWFENDLTADEIALFKQAVAASALHEIVVHSAYLINIASSTATTEATSVKSLAKELQRAEQLGIPYLVLHPGSHTGQGVAAGIAKIARNLDHVLEHATGQTMILLETMAGQGTNLGSTFQELRDIIDLSKHKDLLSVCFDTCHVFASGYAFASEEDYANTMAEFDKVIGKKLIKAFHINGSKMGRGSRLDRHEELGKGELPLGGIACIMKDQHFVHVPKILETPTVELYAQEIAMLRKMGN